MEVIKAKIGDIDRAVEFAYNLQGKISKRCRPLLIDASREDFNKIFTIYIERKEHDVLLVEDNGNLIGLSPIYWMEEDSYVSFSQGPYGDDFDLVANALYQYVFDNYKGYKFYVNTASEHKMACNFYESKSFEKLDEASMLKLENYRSNYISEFVYELNSDNEDEFYNWISTKVDDNTYWNAERIRSNLDNFIILGYFDKEIKGHIIGRGSVDNTEIIAFSGCNVVKEELLKTFVSKAYSNGVSSIDIYADKKTDAIIGIKCGFKVYDNNICYLKNL